MQIVFRYLLFSSKEMPVDFNLKQQHIKNFTNFSYNV